jgi:pyridinium-3,5-bisthiocarboxylic acid mononucleotide nickel chelatase
VSRTALARDWRTVPVRGGDVRVKVGLQAGRIVHATPEFEDVAAVAGARAVPVREVLDEAVAAAEAAGLRSGGAWPPRAGADDGQQGPVRSTLHP